MRKQDDGWGLSESDRDILREIKATVWTWRTEARSGYDLFALGAILTGLDATLNGDAPARIVRVGLSNANRNADDEADVDGQRIDIGAALFITYFRHRSVKTPSDRVIRLNPQAF